MVRGWRGTNSNYKLVTGIKYSIGNTVNNIAISLYAEKINKKNIIKSGTQSKITRHNVETGKYDLKEKNLLRPIPKWG